jgi:hypothetical protein
MRDSASTSLAGRDEIFKLVIRVRIRAPADREGCWAQFAVLTGACTRRGESTRPHARKAGAANLWTGGPHGRSAATDGSQIPQSSPSSELGPVLSFVINAPGGCVVASTAAATLARGPGTGGEESCLQAVSQEHPRCGERPGAPLLRLPSPPERGPGTWIFFSSLALARPLV